MLGSNCPPRFAKGVSVILWARRIDHSIEDDASTAQTRAGPGASSDSAANATPTVRDGLSGFKSRPEKTPMFCNLLKYLHVTLSSTLRDY